MMIILQFGSVELCMGPSAVLSIVAEIRISVFAARELSQISGYSFDCYNTGVRGSIVG
jgi:hypothetical protein